MCSKEQKNHPISSTSNTSPTGIASSSSSINTNTAISPTDNALSQFMKDLQISPSFKIVMDNPRTRASPQMMVYKKSKSEGKGSTRWHATTDTTDSVSGISKVSSLGKISNMTSPPGSKKLRRKLKGTSVGSSSKNNKSKNEEQTRSRRTPSRSSSFDASSISLKFVEQVVGLPPQQSKHSQHHSHSQQQTTRRLSRSYSDHLTTAAAELQPPMLPRRRLSKDVDKAPKMVVRKTSVSVIPNKNIDGVSTVSTANARIPTRRNTSRSPTRRGASRSPTRSNFFDRVVVS
mmetsp:Transcript_8028/g.19408  ORF Transcript_8028/g.19408 Transcript_8028/m.19408 type:complete len:289 (-) Transcript_8028:609-1475(-)